MNLSRRFQSMNVTVNSNNLLHSPDEIWKKNSVQITNLLVQVSAKHGSQIRKLVLNHVEFNNPVDFYKVLSNMPLLNDLVLSRVKINLDDVTYGENVTFSKLNKLTVNTCDWKIFEFFMTSPIKELNITNKFALVDDQQLKTYMRFLEACDKLESIEFDLMAYAKTFLNQMDSKISFKLKRLKYLSFSPSYEMGDIDTNFGTFLQSQASSLKELDLNYTLPSVIKIIFTKLKVLEKLRLHATFLPDNENFYCSFTNMPHLKELTLHDDIPSKIAVKEILRNCKNLETLTAIHDANEHISRILPFIAVHCPLIKNLSLDFLSLASVDVKFQHLKFLHIHSTDNLFTFLSNNTTIEKLSLNLLTENYIPDDAILEALLNQSNILHLTVTAGYITLQTIYMKVKADYRKLKSLELRQLTKPVPNVLIQFPNDKSKWQPSDLASEIFDYEN